jgi:hypothetical protein
MLHLNDELRVFICFIRSCFTCIGSLRWMVRLRPELKPDLTILVRINAKNEAIQDYYLLPSLDTGWRTIQLRENNGIYLDAYRFPSLQFFVGLAARAPIPKTYERRDDSRQDRATRLLFERARAKRGDLLARRVESLKLRARGKGGAKRAAVIDKLHRAAVQLLHGVSVDEAARAAGFKPCNRARAAGGTTRAGDRLMQAARRLGLRVQFNLRQVESKECEGGAGEFVPLSPEYVQALCARPSAVLPLQDGRGGQRWVAKLRRVARANRRQRLLAAGRGRVAERMSRRAARLSRRADQQAARARAARRAFKGQGWAVGSGVPDWFSIVHHSRAVYWGE